MEKSSYELIVEKIKTMRENYPSFRQKRDEIIFTALCIKACFYKNPSLILTDQDLCNFVVDSVSDGGVDALLADPNSEASDLMLCQSKFYQTISFEAVRDAVAKMILFYKAMKRGEYETVNTKIQRTFLSLDAEVGEESKVCFVLFTSAPKNGIREDRIKKLLSEHGLDTVHYDIQLYFADDIRDEIKESESRRPTVENGKLTIDQANNYLEYGENAAIVNVSAFSIKDSYARYGTNLLSRNLRYYIKKRNIDSAINETIARDPEGFWYKNNGLTIICDDFQISGKEVKLKNFSIVNGGQTTSLIHKSKEINKDNDLFLPCKIIKTIGETEDEKNLFSLEIAKATNSQKAIKDIDLKANAPEQIRFGRAMRNEGIFYQTKRGEEIPKDYKEDYKNTDLVEVGKLCLASIFQLPGTSRSKPASLYLEKYYNPVFNEDQAQIATLLKELLYIDFYFRKHFIQQFDRNQELSSSPYATEVIPFAHNARTLCLAFVSFISRFKQKNIIASELRTIFDHCGKENAYDGYYYDIFKDLEGIKYILPKKAFEDKDLYDTILYGLFEIVILAGRRYFSLRKEIDNSLNESNFLKIDQNYFSILKYDWDNIINKVDELYKKYDL